MTVTTAVLYYGFTGLALLVALWPTSHSGRRFLVRWGIPDPTEQQCVLAQRYLRNRRLLYPLLFLLAPLISLPLPDVDIFRALSSLVVALLIAETIAALRPVRGTRVATLHRRNWRDLVPKWAMVLMLTMAAIAVLITLIGLLAQPWFNRVADLTPADGVWHTPGGNITFSEDGLSSLRQPRWVLPIAGVLIGLVCALGVVRLAVRRRSVADPDVDAALRTRTARVAMGIGFAWMWAMIVAANNRLGHARTLRLPNPDFPPQPRWIEYTSSLELLGFVSLFVAAAGWIWVANPPRGRQKTAA